MIRRRAQAVRARPLPEFLLPGERGGRQLKPREPFAVSLTPADRRLAVIDDSKPKRTCMAHNPFEGLGPVFVCAHNAALANASRSELKLRLDQRNDVGGTRQELDERREHLRQRDEAAVNHREIGRMWQSSRRKVADVGPVHHRDPWILSDPPGQLPISNIDRDHGRNARLQQAVGKSAGRRPNIDGGASLHLQCVEVVQGTSKLETSARDISQDRAPLESNLSVLSDERTRLVDRLIIRHDLAREHQGLRFAPRWRKAELNEQEIYPLARGLPGAAGRSRRQLRIGRRRRLRASVLVSRHVLSLHGSLVRCQQPVVPGLASVLDERRSSTDASC